MPVISYKDSKNILFVHVPKCGGSSVERTFRLLGCKISFKHNPFYTDKSLGFPCSPQHFHLDILDRLFARNFFDYKFAIVRDPLQRILSEYRMRMAGRKPENVVEFGRWCLSAFRKFRENEYHLDNHIRPQCHFANESVDVFKLEEGIAPALATACERIGIEFDPQHIVRTNVGRPIGACVEPEIAEVIFDFYREDYDRFGYEPVVSE